MTTQEQYTDLFRFDILHRAFIFANEAHATQKYATIHPYTTHLFDVVMVLVEFGITTPEILAAAMLHDVIEDTPFNYSDVKQHTDTYVADIVYAVSDELGKNRRERKERTLSKLDNFPEAQFVKLADWIANVRQCYRNSHKMYQMYKKDYPSFRKYREQSIGGNLMSHMWDELDRLLERSVKDFKNGHDQHHNEFDGETIRE